MNRRVRVGTAVAVRLSRCTAAQLDGIEAQLGLDPGLLTRSAPPVTRAREIYALVAQKGARQVARLNKLVDAVMGRRRRPASSGSARDNRKVILVLAANPMETERLRLDEEASVIKDRLGEAHRGKRYRLEIEWAVRATDLSRCLLQHQPTIVHIGAHGSPSGEIVLEDQSGRAQAVRVTALASLFRALRGTECVVLNACFSAEQGKELAKHVGCVVGMAKAIGDESALRFAGGFYRALAFGKTYAEAFQLGCVEIDIASLPDAVVPQLMQAGVKRAGSAEPERTNRSAVAVNRTALRKRGPHSIAEDPSAADEDPRRYHVWYATNRKPVDPRSPAKGYSSERDNAVHYGRCAVVVPKSHRIGSLGSSFLRRWLKCSDDRLRLAAVRCMAQREYWARLGASLRTGAPDERVTLVFIHGFNVTFEGAALRAAQIGFDLKVPGTMAFFSWPSKGTLLGYTADEASVDASEEAIADYLADIATKTGTTRLHVLAHSMGNRALLRCLERAVSRMGSAARSRVGQLLLAAPDVDAGVFRDLAKACVQFGQRRTLYVSSRDKALASSGILHDHPRAGYAPPVSVVAGMDTVETKNVDLTFLGHGYYAAARPLLHDMHELLRHDTPPQKRLGLRAAATKAGEPHWAISG